MKNRARLNNFLGQGRKTLYMVLSVLVLSIFTLTMVYAALSTTLNINGQAEVNAANWDIHLDNVVLNSSSATATAPTITNSTTATFSTTLTKPGDFYEFTIDVVNNGSIDAMIDSVTKTPTLTATQAKYLNYIVEYQNGDAITTKQLVSKNSYVRLLVKVEFRKDISASDLPTTSETLNLSFTVNYTQADETGTNVTDNGVKKAYKVISGDLNTVGSEICIGEECFYLVNNNGSSITMFAKMNITTETIPKQSNLAATMSFALSNYWGTVSSGTYVYNSNSALYNYVQNYKIYLESQGVKIEEARLINLEELESLGCSRTVFSCSSAPSWVYATSYWTGAANNNTDYLLMVRSIGEFGINSYSVADSFGIRPVMTLII